MMRTHQANRVLIVESVCRRARVCGLIRRGARRHSAARKILQLPDEQPSTSGVTLYLNAPDGVDATLARVEAAGGKITRPKMSIGENGVIALILDTEGNEVGLHGMQ